MLGKAIDSQGNIVEKQDEEDDLSSARGDLVSHERLLATELKNRQVKTQRRKFTSQPRGATMLKSLDRDGLPEIGGGRISVQRKIKVKERHESSISSQSARSLKQRI